MVGQSRSHDSYCTGLAQFSTKMLFWNRMTQKSALGAVGTAVPPLDSFNIA